MTLKELENTSGVFALCKRNLCKPLWQRQLLHPWCQGWDSPGEHKTGVPPHSTIPTGIRAMPLQCCFLRSKAGLKPHLCPSCYLALKRERVNWAMLLSVPCSRLLQTYIHNIHIQIYILRYKKIKAQTEDVYLNFNIFILRKYW